jgi:trehalose 6-phosphate synthase
MNGRNGIQGRNGPHGRSRRLLLVSNRGPVEYSADDRGRVCRLETCGGVATALGAVAQSMPVTWIACAASEQDRELAADGEPIRLPGGGLLRFVAPPADAYDLSYRTFCNPILWFLQHGLWDRLERPNLAEEVLHAWERGYLPVNQWVADAVVDELRSSASPPSVMLHDYHFYLAPLFVRQRVPRAVLQHFVHIPWPRADAWKYLPAAIVTSICEGLLANDSIVFQTEASVRNFLHTCKAYLPDADVRFATETVHRGGRRTRVWANPISVNVPGLQAWLALPESRCYYESLAGEVAERTIVRVDRIDPAKNIMVGFQAFDLMLEKHPEWVGRVRFLAFLIPSRVSIPEYRSYAEEVFSLVEGINRRHGRGDWTPIKVYGEQNRLRALVGLTLYDVLLVNSLADGMNLVSKEGPAVNTKDGVLVLSEGAGSMTELRQGAIPVRPEEIEETADALHEALTLPVEERRRRAQLLRQVVARHDLDRWLRRQLEDLAEIEAGEPALVTAR